MHWLMQTAKSACVTYSMLEISQQLLFAWVMRPHYTLLDGALFLRPSFGFLSDLLPKQGIASAHILGSKP